MRDKSLDAVKGFAILLVMIGHCLVWNQMTDPFIYDAIDAIQMPLFMMVSGYLAGMGKRIETSKTLWQVMSKRAVSYLLPFFSWLIITHPEDFLLEWKATLFQLDRGLWFLMVLFLVSCIVLFAEFFGRKFMKIPIIGICYLSLFAASRLGITFLSPALVMEYMPYYVIAYLFTNDIRPYAKKMEWINKRKTTPVIGAVLLLSLMFFIYATIGFDLVHVSSYKVLVIQMSASLLGSFFVFCLVYFGATGVVKKGLAYMGGYTLEIYAMQYALHFHFAEILNLPAKKLSLYSFEGVFWILISLLLMGFLTFVTMFFVSKIPVLNFLLVGKRIHHSKICAK